MSKARKPSLFDPESPSRRSSRASKAQPVHMVKNPVMFVTKSCRGDTVELFFAHAQGESFAFVLQIALWLCSP